MPASKQRILFWNPRGFEYEDFEGCSGRPQQFEGGVDNITPETVQKAVELLQSPENKIAYRGFAECRICGKRLGTCDYEGNGFVWPEKAEHYILEHGVWVASDMEPFLAAVGISHVRRSAEHGRKNALQEMQNSSKTVERQDVPKS